jgi:hypothetical protein
MAFICADILLPQIKKLPQRRLVRLAWCLAYVACAHALPILLAGLVQIPRVGLQFLPDVLAGVWFTLRQAWLPLLVGSGALYFVFQIRRSAQPVNGETRESRHPPPPEGTRGMP